MNHTLWDRVLKKYVQTNGQIDNIPLHTFDYVSLRNNRDQDFSDYLQLLADATPFAAAVGMSSGTAMDNDEAKYV